MSRPGEVFCAAFSRKTRVVRRAALHVHCAVHEIFEAQRSAEEAFDAVIKHVQVGIIVQGADGPCAHEQVFCAVHQLVADIGVFAGFDIVDNDIIGLCPGAVCDLSVIAEVGQVNAVGPDILVRALAELTVVVAGAGDPHVEHGDRVVVGAHPAVAGDGIAAGFSGVEECAPLLVLQLHIDACGCQGALQVFADRLVGFTGVVEVSQGWEVFDLLGGLIKLIVFLKFPMQYIDNLPAAQAGISDFLSLEADSAEH